MTREVIFAFVVGGAVCVLLYGQIVLCSGERCYQYVGPLF